MLVERKPIAINGTDFTGYFADTGYTVNYVKRTGSNGGMMADGSLVEDVIAIKAEVVLPCIPLTDEQISALLTALYSTEYPTVEYYDPKTGVMRLVLSIASVTTSKYRGHGSDANAYWTGLNVKLAEK